MSSSGGEHHHRSLFSSKNRPFKGKSKGKLERANRGKVDSGSHLAAASSSKAKATQGSIRNSFSSNTPGAHRIPIKHSIELSSKAARQHRARQLRQQARQDLFQKKRIGNRQGPPKIVALIPLGQNVDLTKIVTFVQNYADATQEGIEEEMKKVEKSTNPLIRSIAVNMSGRQRRITLYSTPRDTNSVLDIAKVADIVMFVLGPAANAPNDDIDVDAFGTHCLAILKAQGMPAVMGLQVGSAATPLKKQAPLRKLAQRYFDTACGADTKVLQMDTQEDAAGFFRWIASDVKLKPITWRDARPYILAEQVAFDLDPASTTTVGQLPGQFSFSLTSTPTAASSSSSSLSSDPYGTLRLRGYLRGENPLQPNQLFHLTGYGDFQIAKVEGRIEEAQVYQTEKEKKQSRAASKAASKMVSRRGSIGGDADMDDGASSTVPSMSSTFQMTAPAMPNSRADGADVTLVTATPTEQETLDGLVPLNPLANEQSLIDDDELADEGPDEDDDDHYDHDGDDDAMDDADGDAEMQDEDDGKDTSGRLIESGRRKKFAKEIKPAAVKKASKPGAIVKSQVEWDDAVPNDEEGEEDDEDDQLNDSMADETPDIIQKRKLERDEAMFPDEVEFPMDTSCKDRFARYRGLKSFQHSFWDSKENLPLEYGQIYQFANFEASKNRVLKAAILGEGELSEENSVLPQRFYPVTIYLTRVPVTIAESICKTLAPIVGFGIFKYEHKVSVLHMSVKRANEYEEPIKAKEPMEFHVAFRRFVSRPIYSVEGHSDKHLTKRFFQRGDFMIASVYGRIVFPPADVIMFKPTAAMSSLMIAASTSSTSSPSVAPGTLARALIPAPLTSLTNIPFVSPIIASGVLLSINPDRLLIKRIVLTGTPISVHKRNAVVRHMFFNAADIAWFKPVELTTKYGLVGHIKESRGTKGYMKCQFDKFITQNDTVCMDLYKRQFPPWNEELFQGHA